MDKKTKITVIDDEEALVATLKEFLEARNFEVSCAYGGREGLDIIRKELPELIILDITMSDMDGRDVLVALKKDENTSTIPVILLTGRDEQFDRELGVELGAKEYLVKPCDWRLLMKKVETILG